MPDSNRAQRPSPPPVPVQVISIVFYAGFAISVSITAMAMFGIVGVLLAVFFAWMWGQIPSLGGRGAGIPGIEELRPHLPETKRETSGNATFDAYRSDLMARLEREQADFERFLGRLRDAKDQTEFDRFMDDRSNARSTSREAERPEAGGPEPTAQRPAEA